MLIKRHATQLLLQTAPYNSNPHCYGGESHDALERDSICSPLSKKFDALIWSRMNHFKVSGLAVAVVDGTKTHSRGYGIAQFPDVQVTPDTVFYGASTTKAFVAAALSLLIDRSENYLNVQWTTPISELIREDFVLSDDYATDHVTLEDAASHRTGLPRHDLSLKGGNQTVRDVVRSLRFLPLTKPIRAAFQYCNLMYVTLGHVIETLSGQWLGDFLFTRIWKPLNMTSTYFSLADALDSENQVARGHVWLESKRKYVEIDYVDESSAEGAGGVLSTVLDYSKWAKMILNRGRPISETGYKALLTPHMIDEMESFGGPVLYGLGWELSQYRGYEVIMHDGAESGFGSNIVLIPAKSWACIMMANTDLTSNVVVDILTWHLIDELLETPKAFRVNRTKLYDDGLAEYYKQRDTTWVREQIYPSDKLANISASLPLEDYAGTYSHPGYGRWHLQYENGTLWNKLNRKPVLSWVARLEHLSGDRFFMIVYPDDSPEIPGYSEAEFVVNLEGRVVSVGLILEEKMIANEPERDRKIWFDRVT